MTTFFDHLAALRSKLLLCFFAVVVGAGIAHAFHVTIIATLLMPVRGQSLVFLSPLDPLVFIFKIDLVAGLLLALPVISWSTLSFLRPAMRPVRWTAFCAVFTLAAVLLLAGLAYSYLVVVPLTLRFLLSISVAGIGNMLTASSYLSFLLLQLLLMAALFQIPLFILAGVWIGAFDPSALAAKRRYIYVGGLIALAVVTPTTDVFSLGVVAVPALFIFEGSLLAARVVGRFRHVQTLGSGGRD